MSHHVQPWRLFDARLHHTERLSPSFVRLTFHGPDLGDFADTGLDTRCKLVLPADEGGYAHLPRGDAWLQDLRRLPAARRCPVRTYTVRAVRRGACEVDVDAVVHDHPLGPAGRWVADADIGAPIVLVGPNAAHPGPHGGAEWAPPTGTERVLVAGDETAVPAIASILEALAPATRGVALLEVPVTADRWAVDAPPGVQVVWLPRDGRAHGSRLAPAVDEALDHLVVPAGPWTAAPGAEHFEDVDVDAEPLWDVPPVSGGEGGDGLYAWLAGESGVVAQLRRRLVRDRGIDRGAVAFMGYWRRGRTGG